MGRTESAFKYLLNDEDDFLSVSGLQLNEVSIAALAKVHDSKYKVHYNDPYSGLRLCELLSWSIYRVLTGKCRKVTYYT